MPGRVPPFELYFEILFLESYSLLKSREQKAVDKAVRLLSTKAGNGRFTCSLRIFDRRRPALNLRAAATRRFPRDVPIPERANGRYDADFAGSGYGVVTANIRPCRARAVALRRNPEYFAPAYCCP